MLRSNTLRFCSGAIKQFQRCSSSTPNPALVTEKITEELHGVNNVSSSSGSPDSPSNVDKEKDKAKARSNLVTAAFASLHHNKKVTNNKNIIDEKIRDSNTAEELLFLSENSMLTKAQVLQVVTTLTEWSMKGKINDEFESDPRFISLCKILGKSPLITKSEASLRDGDLSVVMGVAAEDEAAKMIQTITVPQMIKVLCSLSYKRRRSLPLLKALASNICEKEIKLDIKQSADILFALASLNFPHEDLLKKVSNDLNETISNCQKSAVIGSICMSIGLLRYKDTELLGSLCNWALENKSIARPQDFVSLLLCLANVKYSPNKDLLDLIQVQVEEDDVPTANTWLDVVWALAVLDSASSSSLASVLRPKFIERLSNSKGSSAISWKKKLLNINGLAKFTKGYKGPFLTDDSDMQVPLTRSKDKQLLIGSVVDTLSSMFPSPLYFRTSIDTGMGFLLDAECIIDSKLNPSPVIDKSTGEPILPKSGKRIALLVHDYHDCTRGCIGPCGTLSFNAALAELAGYKAIPLLYTDYSPHSKLVDRAKYIESLLKNSVNLTV